MTSLRTVRILATRSGVHLNLNLTVLVHSTDRLARSLDDLPALVRTTLRGCY